MTENRLSGLPEILSGLLVLIIAAACTTPAPQSIPTATPIVTVEITGNTHPESRVVKEEVVPQNNCGGNSETETEIHRSRTIAHTLDVGEELQLSVDGQIGIFGTDVGLGAAIASQLGHSYGATEEIAKAIVVKAQPGTALEHQIRQQEIWEVGEAKIVVGSQEKTLPFSFLDDFTIELVDSTSIPCSTTVVSTTALITAVETSTAPSTLPNELYVFGPEFGDDSYLLKGTGISQHSAGDNLVVYGEISPGTEIAIALLKVIRLNPDSLSAQAILVHPNLQIRPTLRVDDQLNYISTSELIPSAEYALGYLLRPGRIRVRPNSGIQVDSVLQALEFEVVDETVLDALPFDSPIVMRVTSVGASGAVASAELVEGNWPITGTIVAAVDESISLAPAEEATQISNAGPMISDTQTVTISVTPLPVQASNPPTVTLSTEIALDYVLAPGINHNDKLAVDANDEYTFAGETNVPVLFSMQRTEGDLNYTYEIIAPDGEVFSDHVGYSSQVLEIPFTPQVDGQYTLRLNGTHNFGSYTVKLDIL